MEGETRDTEEEDTCAAANLTLSPEFPSVAVSEGLCVCVCVCVCEWEGECCDLRDKLSETY